MPVRAVQKSMNSTLTDKPHMVFASIFFFCLLTENFTDCLCRAKKSQLGLNLPNLHMILS